MWLNSDSCFTQREKFCLDSVQHRHSLSISMLSFRWNLGQYFFSEESSLNNSFEVNYHEQNLHRAQLLCTWLGQLDSRLKGVERKILLQVLQNRIWMQVLPAIFCRSSFLYWPQVVLGETRSLLRYETRDPQQKQLFIRKKPKSFSR